MNPKQSPDYAELQKKRIVDAAWELFAERGYHATTMREVAARLGMTTGVVYTYFEGKDEIIDALAERSRGHSAMMLERLSIEGSARAAIRRLFDMLAESWVTEKGQLGVRANLALMAEAARNERIRAAATELYAGTRKLFTTLAERGAAKGEFGGNADPEALGAFFSALFLGLQMEQALMDHADVKGHLAAVSSVILSDDDRSGEIHVDAGPGGRGDGASGS